MDSYSLIRILVIGFIVNLIWENLQAPLYNGYHSFAQHFPICLLASVVDGLVILALYWLQMALARRFRWADHHQTLIIILMALIIAGATELAATQWGWWSYSSQYAASTAYPAVYSRAMPVVPILGIGLLPLAQLPILSFVTLRLLKFL